jgi:hypothetical protein
LLDRNSQFFSQFSVEESKRGKSRCRCKLEFLCHDLAISSKTPRVLSLKINRIFLFGVLSFTTFCHLFTIEIKVKTLTYVPSHGMDYLSFVHLSADFVHLVNVVGDREENTAKL